MFYGTADFEVCSDDSPKEIVRMINTEGAGEAVYEEVEGADHSMFMAGSMEEGVSMDRDQRREMMMQGIDPGVCKTVINWIIK